LRLSEKEWDAALDLADPAVESKLDYKLIARCALDEQKKATDRLRREKLTTSQAQRGLRSVPFTQSLAVEGKVPSMAARHQSHGVYTHASLGSLGSGQTVLGGRSFDTPTKVRPKSASAKRTSQRRGNLPVQVRQRPKSAAVRRSPAVRDQAPAGYNRPLTASVSPLSARKGTVKDVRRYTTIKWSGYDSEPDTDPEDEGDQDQTLLLDGSWTWRSWRDLRRDSIGHGPEEEAYDDEVAAMMAGRMPDTAVSGDDPTLSRHGSLHFSPYRQASTRHSSISGTSSRRKQSSGGSTRSSARSDVLDGGKMVLELGNF